MCLRVVLFDYTVLRVYYTVLMCYAASGYGCVAAMGTFVEAKGGSGSMGMEFHLSSKEGIRLFRGSRVVMLPGL